MEEDGIEIIAQEERQLTEEEAREFYSHLAEEASISSLRVFFFDDYNEKYELINFKIFPLFIKNLL